VSVVMAVMVINLYNRGSKANRAPYFVKKIVLCWMCKLLRMSNDLEKLAKTIKLVGHLDQQISHPIPSICHLRPLPNPPILPSLTLSEPLNPCPIHS
jgi:hypothetical protein